MNHSSSSSSSSSMVTRHEGQASEPLSLCACVWHFCCAHVEGCCRGARCAHEGEVCYSVDASMVANGRMPSAHMMGKCTMLIWLTRRTIEQVVTASFQQDEWLIFWAAKTSS